MSPGLKCYDLALDYAQCTEIKSKLYKIVWRFINIMFRLSNVPLFLSYCHYAHSIFIHLCYHMAFYVWIFLCILHNTLSSTHSLLFPILYTLKTILLKTHLHPFSRQLILETGGWCKNVNARIKILALLHLSGVITSIHEQFNFSVSHFPQI